MWGWVFGSICVRENKKVFYKNYTLTLHGTGMVPGQARLRAVDWYVYQQVNVLW